MADKKISELLSSTTPLTGNEIVPIVQSSTTKKVSIDDLTSGKTVKTGNVLVGATASALQGGGTGITIYHSASPEIKFVNNATGTAITDGTAFGMSGNSFLLNNREVASVQVYTSNTRRFEISALGDVELVSGNLSFTTAGKGIDFSANTNAAGMTSELLNWYEEGTWTPSLRGSSTAGTYELATASSWYTRIGRQVTAMFDIKLNAAITGGGTGFLCIAGLPFNAATTAATVGSCVLSGVGFSASAAYVVITPRGVGSPQIILQDIYANAGSGAVDVTTLAANDILQGTLTYLA